MSKTLEQFEQYLDKMKKYEHINTLLYWDMRTCAPKLGQAGHIDALTYFSTESFAMSTSDELYPKAPRHTCVYSAHCLQDI